jgi:hypothetical protein
MKYEYSFSGADVKSIVYYPGGDRESTWYGSFGKGEREDWTLNSLHSVSLSVHEAKDMVRSLGYRGIRGTTSSVRTIAGTMIFLVVNDHPLRDLIRNCYQSPLYRRTGWSIDREQVGVGSIYGNIQQLNRLATMIPPFNMINIAVNELGSTREGAEIYPNDRITGPVNPKSLYGSGMAEMIEGIEFIDEGKVISINDIVTEITFSFIARNIKPLSINPLYRSPLEADIDAIAKEAIADSMIGTMDPSVQGTVTAFLGWDFNQGTSAPVTEVIEADLRDSGMSREDILRVTGVNTDDFDLEE